MELVNLIALENLRSRFNATFRIGAAGFSEWQVCARMETPADAPERVAHTETPAAERDRVPA